MNLVIYGLPEHQGSISTECQSKDSDSLRELVHSEFSVDNLEINKIIRLGKFFKDKPRPLLVTLSDKSVRRHILLNAKILCKSNTYKQVFISPDFSIKERESNKLLRLELLRRKQEGERNLIIRHGKIVSIQLPLNNVAAMKSTSPSD